MTQALFLAEIQYYSGSLQTLYYSTGAFTTRPAETPANQYYDAKLKQPAFLSRHCFSEGHTLGRSKVAYGDLVLINDDGALDGLLAYAFDGRTVTIREGVAGAAYPGGFTTRLVATIDGVPEFTDREVRFKLRDQQAKLDVPIQPTKYAGNNSLPAGLEGVATDLKGKPKPFVYGAVANISPPCVNTSKLIYQVNDGAVSSIPSVYDRGVALLAGRVWTNRGAGGFTVAIRAATAGGGVYVLAGSNGELATSPDGTAWTSRTSGFGSTIIYALANNGATYVAVGGAGKVSYSTDSGATWTISASAAAQFGATDVKSVAWSPMLSLFFAAGDSGVLATSADGITWAVQAAASTAMGGQAIYGIVEGAGVVVLVGGLGTIVTTDDGTTFAARTTSFSPDSFFSVAYGNSLFVATGDLVATSADGYTWTKQLNVPASGMTRVTFGVQFVTVGASNTLHSSEDGANWTTQALPTAFNSTVMNAIAFADGVYVAGGGTVIASAATTTFANATDLENDEYAPMAGENTSCPSAGYFRLGSSPAGLITCDVTEGTAASDRTAAQLFKRILEEAGYTSSNYSAADVTALDALNDDVLGIWIPDETTISAVLDQVAGSVVAWWGVDQAGLFRIQQLLVPSGTAAATFTANDLIKPLTRLATQDEGKGVPVWRVIICYGKIWTVQNVDLAGSVTDARRAVVGQEWRSVKYETASVQAAHLLSPTLNLESLQTVEADALAEATRQQTLRGTRRDRYLLVVELNAVNSLLDLGSVIDLTHARFGLSAGKKFRVLGIVPDFANMRAELTVWGGV